MSKRPREDPHKYIEVWSFQSSPRVKIVINRMIIPEKEREGFLNEEYLKKMESKEQMLITMLSVSKKEEILIFMFLKSRKINNFNKCWMS